MNQVYKLLQKALQAYRDEKKGPTFIALQIMEDVKVLQSKVSVLNDFPYVEIHFHVIAVQFYCSSEHSGVYF